MLLDSVAEAQQELEEAGQQLAAAQEELADSRSARAQLQQQVDCRAVVTAMLCGILLG